VGAVAWCGVIAFFGAQKMVGNRKKVSYPSKNKSDGQSKDSFQSHEKMIRSTLGFAEPSTKLPIWYCHKTTTRYHRTQNNPSIH
jgi:hypothetical protein